MPHLFNANRMPSSDTAPWLFSDVKPTPDGMDLPTAGQAMK